MGTGSNWFWRILAPSVVLINLGAMILNASTLVADPSPWNAFWNAVSIVGLIFALISLVRWWRRGLWRRW
jgi:hypothetical protein